MSKEKPVPKGFQENVPRISVKGKKKVKLEIMRLILFRMIVRLR